MTRRPRALAAAGAVLLLAPLAGGCTDDDAAASDDSQTLTVLAASSLTDAFGDLAKAFEADHPGVDVQLTFDSSSTLAEQVVAGAPADVLATADEAIMQRVADEDLAEGEPEQFARNKLTLVTPSDNPGDVQSIADLGNQGVTFAVCVPDAPCGAASETLLDLVGVTAEPVTEEDNVRDVLTKVTTGEVDAGLVYVSDAQAAGDDVEVIDVPEADQALNADMITALAEADEPELAAAWVNLVTSEEGQQVLESYGFLPAT
jgi:molybdate transport system substrate-binding protein